MSNEKTTIKDVLSISRCSLHEFSIKYDVPYRTVVSWSSGRRSPPYYVTLALLRCVLCDIGYCVNSENYKPKDT